MGRRLMVVALVATSLTGCISNPCTPLKPTAAERGVVESGGSVEREVRGTECELEDLDTGFQRDD